MSGKYKTGEVEVSRNCLQGGCGRFNGYLNCVRCGFNVYEYERRRALPLIEGEDGLRRKHAGAGEEKMEV